MNTTTTFETERASRYLTSLCHHFARKVEAECDDRSGWVQFRSGRCDMTADDRTLALSVSADDQHHLDQVVQIVTSHLERFAFRENPTLAWKMQAG